MPLKGKTIYISEFSLDEIQRVTAFVEEANTIVFNYFGITTSFDILICRGSWQMELQMVSRKHHSGHSGYVDYKIVGITDYQLEEIVIRYDTAKFGHYLHELIHGIIHKSYPHQLKEGLAWYFTLKLTEKYRYVRPSYPAWIDEIYVRPTAELVQSLGEDFVRDLALGKAAVLPELLPRDLQDLFLPESLFYSNKRSYG